MKIIDTTLQSTITVGVFLGLLSYDLFKGVGVYLLSGFF